MFLRVLLHKGLLLIELVLDLSGFSLQVLSQKARGVLREVPLYLTQIVGLRQLFVWGRRTVLWTEVL